MSKTTWTEVAYKWRVRIGFLGILLAIILSKPTYDSIYYGAVLLFFGILIRIWSCGHIKKEKELTISGPYRYTRNPLYFGNLILGSGIVISTRSRWIFAYFIVYFLLFYPIIINKEKNKMKELFPKEYEEFSKKVPLFIPRLKATLKSSSTRFSWVLYIKNKEYRALIGAILFWLILAAKISFL